MHVDVTIKYDSAAITGTRERSTFQLALILSLVCSRAMTQKMDAQRGVGLGRLVPEIVGSNPAYYMEDCALILCLVKVLQGLNIHRGKGKRNEKSKNI
jgi:hypothetical protein